MCVPFVHVPKKRGNKNCNNFRERERKIKLSARARFELLSRALDFLCGNIMYGSVCSWDNFMFNLVIFERFSLSNSEDTKLV